MLKMSRCTATFLAVVSEYCTCYDSDSLIDIAAKLLGALGDDLRSLGDLHLSDIKHGKFRNFNM